MKWNNKRKGSLYFHIGAFLIPFAVSTGSSAVFWTQHSGLFLMGIITVLVIEVMAVISFIADMFDIDIGGYILLKRVLPLVSSVGIIELLFRIFTAHNNLYVASTLTLVMTAVVITWLYWACQGIERAVRGTGLLTPEEHVFTQLIAIRDKQLEQTFNGLVIDAQDYTAIDTVQYPCPYCGSDLHSPQAVGQAKRRGKCRHCSSVVIEE